MCEGDEVRRIPGGRGGEGASEACGPGHLLRCMLLVLQFSPLTGLLPTGLLCESREREVVSMKEIV